MRSTNNPHFSAIDDIRRLITRIELELDEPEPDVEAIKSAARTIKVQVRRFSRFKGL